ncbi:unnamed protein product [Orchesella dallaii]|uniref:Uncharacterized protein n=1 Tax=Orchesella dallaii TaxID=48710 RepID=A0ABP1RCY0_9HEXA
MDEIYFQVIITAPMFLSMGLNYYFFQHRYSIIEYVGRLFNFVSEFQSLEIMKKTTVKEILRDYIKELGKILTTGKGDYLGVTLVGSVLMLTFGSPLMGLTAYFAQQDGFAVVLKYIFPVENRSDVEHVLLRLLSSILVTIGAIDTTRTFRYVFVYLIVVAKITSKLIKSIRVSSRQNLNSAMDTYKRMYKIHNTILEPSAQYLFVAVHGGQFLAVFDISGSLVGWKFLSPLAYWVLPFMTTLTIFVIVTAVPFAILPAEESKGMIKDWKYEYGLKRNKLQKRVMASLRPIGWKLGGYGVVQRGFKAHWWTVIVYNTQDAVLMIMDIVFKK